MIILGLPVDQDRGSSWGRSTPEPYFTDYETNRWYKMMKALLGWRWMEVPCPSKGVMQKLMSKDWQLLAVPCFCSVWKSIALEFFFPNSILSILRLRESYILFKGACNYINPYHRAFLAPRGPVRIPLLSVLSRKKSRSPCDVISSNICF